MDAVKFIKERTRLCQMYEGCGSCPACHASCGCIFSVTNGATPEEQSEFMEAWSAAHPRKKRQSIFLEQYPEVSIGDDGVLRVCPFLIDASYRNNDGSCKSVQRQCSDCRKEFWGQEVE